MSPLGVNPPTAHDSLTPAHVLLPAHALQLRLVAIALQGQPPPLTLPLTLVARDPSLELIVLQAAPPAAAPLRPLSIVPSSQLQVGQDVFLLGSTPEGGRTLAAGVLSATGRALSASNGQRIRGALQTDAQLGALGLGGAMVDSGGRLMGVPTVSYTSPGAGRSSGVSFAVGSDQLLAAVPNLIAYGNAAGRG